MTRFNATCRVVKYLKHKPDRSLFLYINSEVKILAYSDSDWADCIDSRSCISRYYFFISSSLILWHAKKKHIVSRSSSEIEYKAFSIATCELQWLLHLLQDLHITSTKQLVQYCDNQSALHFASNLVYHERTKLLGIYCHLVREKVQKKFLIFLPIPFKNI